MRPSVSVVIPAHNAEATIGPTIESVRRQTIRDVEIIVVDDGSTDDTPAQVQRCGPAIRYLRQKQQGVSAARNYGLRESTGEFVAFLDGDDLWRAQKLEVPCDCSRTIE